MDCIRDGVKPVFCGHDCGGDACPLLAHVESGRVVRISHNPAAGTRIRGCRRGYELPQLHYSSKRLKSPLIATGPRGSGLFREASWDEALGLVTAKLGEIRAAHGASSILCLASAGSTGALHNTEVLAARFLNATGGCCSLSGSYSNGAAKSVLPWVLGPEWKDSGFDASTMRYASLIILWGANIPETRLGPELPARLAEAASRGVPVIVIDPRRTAACQLPGARWIPCKPGTDAALMLAILHTLIAENLVDTDFVRAMSVGFDALSAYVTGSSGGTPKTPLWASKITGVDGTKIRCLARAWAAAKPAMLIPGYSIQRVSGGEECFRLTVALQIATGNFGRKGGSTGSLNNRLGGPRVGKIDGLSPSDAPVAPIGRWPDAILEGQSGGYAADIAAAYVAGCNFLNQGADIRKNVAAFDALKFAVCHDMFLTPTARHCDVVLPVASPLEKSDIGIPWAGNYLLYKDRIAPGEGMTRNDYDIFAELAERSGSGDAFTQGKTERGWIESFLDASEVTDREAFMQSGFYGIESERAGCDAFAADPVGHPLGTASGKVELESRSYAAATGSSSIPVWKERLRDPAYSLDLITPKTLRRTHSQGGDLSVSGSDRLSMNPVDASARGVAEGSQVRVRNDRGTIVCVADLDEGIMPGTVSLPEGVWFEAGTVGSGDGNASANFLTSTEGTGAEHSCVMHAVPVEIERLS